MGRWRVKAAAAFAAFLLAVGGRTGAAESFLESAREYLESRNLTEMEILWELEEQGKDRGEKETAKRQAYPDDRSDLQSDPNVTIVPEMQRKLEEALRSGQSLKQKTGREDPSLETELSFRGLQTVFNYLFVGDSRFVGMESAVGNGEASWICKTSMGLEWLQSAAAPLIDDMDISGYAIILNLGVNDLYNASAYVSFLNDKVPKWREKGASVYYMSVNPVSQGASVTNDEIAVFNQTVYESLPPGTGWIDTMNYLLEDGFSAPDGLHYDNATYQKIYAYAMEAVKGGT